MTLALGLVHSCRALLLCQRWRMNKFSNFKIHWCICSHCQKRTDKYKINLAYRPICWQHILWPLPGTGAGGTTGASWGHQTYQQVFCKATQIRSSGLAIHTSGLNCHWLKVIIALEVMVFLALCILSFCSHKTSLSGSVFAVAPSKSVHNYCIPY